MPPSGAGVATGCEVAVVAVVAGGADGALVASAAAGAVVASGTGVASSGDVGLSPVDAPVGEGPADGAPAPPHAAKSTLRTSSKPRRREIVLAMRILNSRDSEKTDHPT